MPSSRTSPVLTLGPQVWVVVLVVLLGLLLLGAYGTV